MLKLVSELEGHQDSRVWHASWSTDGNYISSCGEDKIILIWRLNKIIDDYKIVCVSTLEDAQSRTIRSCEWSNDDSMIATASFDGTIVVWEAQNRIDKRYWNQIASLEGHENEVKSVCWNSDSTRLATCGRDKSIWIWEKIVNGEFECVTVLNGHTQDVKFLKWHHHEQLIMSCSYDDTIKIWREDDDEWYCANTLIGHNNTVWGLSLNLLGDKLVSCSADMCIIIWESASGLWTNDALQVYKLDNTHDFPIYSVDWSHNHGYIVSGGGDNNIVLYSTQLNENGAGVSVNVVSKQYNSHESDINCVRWNPNPENSKLLLSCGDDGLVKVWKFEI